MKIDHEDDVSIGGVYLGILLAAKVVAELCCGENTTVVCDGATEAAAKKESIAMFRAYFMAG